MIRKFSEVLAVVIALVGSAFAQHVRQFKFSGANGSNPQGGVVFDDAGNLYGSAYAGGSTNLGVVYEITPTQNGATETVLYEFMGRNNGDGANPIGDLIFDQSGNLYGVTQYGGSLSAACNEELGCGTVFELSPPLQLGEAWTETVLYRFQGDPTDGNEPLAGLVFDSAGNLYGTTAFGGLDNGHCTGCGTVFVLSPPSQSGGGWTETILYEFQGGSDGYQPMGGLVFDPAGNLYGTTSLGGEYSGTIFQLTPPLSQGNWSETVIHNLFPRTDGSDPVAGLVLIGNTLYGTASVGGLYGQGTVFRLFPRPNSGMWTYEVVHNFAGNGDGARPFSPLTVGSPNTVYGTTYGGANVFRITGSGTSGTFSVLCILSGNPRARVTLSNSAIYGTTVSGSNNNGTVFQLSH